MQRFMRRHWACVILIFILFFLSSCGAKKKSVLRNTNSSVYGATSHPINKSAKHRNLKQYYAELLNTDAKNLNMDLYTVIEEWMDTPHRMGGLDKNGIDCSAFVSLVYLDVYGKNLPRISRDMGDNIKRKYDQDLKEGDLVFFSFGGKNIDHVGIYLGNDRFVHVSTKKGVMISNLKEAWYYKYLTRCGTPK